jgi:hypothetical protein
LGEGSRESLTVGAQLPWMEGSICAAGERGAAANANRGDGGRFAAGGRGAGGDRSSRERRAKRGERGGWRGRTFHLHTRGPFLVADRAGNVMAGRRGRRERGRVLHTTPFLPWSSRARLDRGDGDLPCAGHDTIPSLKQPSGDGARGWRCGRGQRERGRRGRRERGRRERGRDSRGEESGGARERATVGKTVHQNRCVRLHYRLIE